MLVLGRHVDQRILIGDDVVITVVDIRGNLVRLGVDAPAFVPVHRQEIYDAIQREGNKKPRPIMLSLPPEALAVVEKMAADRRQDVGEFLSAWITQSVLALTA